MKRMQGRLDSDDKGTHMNNMHNGHFIEFVAVADASQSTLNGYFGKPKVKSTEESGKQQDQDSIDQCHPVPVIQESREDAQAKDEELGEESETDIQVDDLFAGEDYEIPDPDEQEPSQSLNLQEESTVNEEPEVESPQQPLLQQFPGRQFENERFVRRFKPEWYKAYPWLSYNTVKDERTCFACTNFSKETSFVFNNWKKPNKLSKHNASAKHLTSMTKWLLYKAAKSSSTSVLKQLDSYHSEKVKSNHQYLKVIIKCLMFNAQQNFANRGHEESRQNIWEVSDINRGRKFLGVTSFKVSTLALVEGKIAKSAQVPCPMNFALYTKRANRYHVRPSFGKDPHRG